jgi:type I restriction-modification system DNA methylase subunit
LGECESLGLVVYEVRHSSKHDARVGLTKEAFRLLADEFCERALVFFVPEDDDSNYRFSLIEITLDQSEESSRISRRYSNPHRYSYYLGKGIAYYTPNKYLNEYGRVVSVEDLRNRFSVEVLTRAFYQELSDWYAWAIMVVRFPNDLKTLEDNQKYNSEAMIRLITRLIFVWFLKQRHLVPDEFFDEQYIATELIEGFTPHDVVDLFGKSYESKYYKGVLQNLFFAMLNSPITPEGKDTISERRFRNGRGDYDNNKLMRHEDLFINPDKFVELANKYVPFLNGGLFDCLDDKDKGIYIDAFTDRNEISKQLVIPDFLFFGDEVGRNIDLSEWYGDKKKKRVSARGIIDILKRYNFTVEENTPFDQEVSLDPELLGKVFENLLAAYNPETQTTARKQTGSFYTPREIVQYMVDESLVAHLKRTVGEDLEPEYRKLVQYTDEGLALTDDQKRQIMQSLYECKVLDPACGSGAFPMGMLQQMVHILNRIDPNNEQWKEMMLNNAISETSEAYHNATDEERAEIVADIERSFNESINRPDYARKLYLIENCIYGVDIQPIAIQISKLRFFISLVVDQKTNNNPVDNFGIRPLPNLEAKFVAANTLVNIKKRDADLFTSEAILNKEAEMKDAKHRIFGAKTVKTKRKYKERVIQLRDELATMLEDIGAVGNLEAQQLAAWDMFDQNASSSFFDSEWMFGVCDGFDIIIGNPPYIKERDNRLFFLPVISTDWGRMYHANKMDFWYYFLHKAIEIGSNSAIICFITSRYWTKSTGAKKIIQHIKDTANIIEIVDFGKLKVFDAVVGLHMISLIGKKQKNSKDEDCLYRKVSDNVENIISGTWNNERVIKSKDLITENCEINIESEKLELHCDCDILGNLYSVSQGVVEANAKVSSKSLKKYPSNEIAIGDGVFVLSKEELDILELNDKENGLMVKYLGEGAIDAYHINTNNPQYLIYTDGDGKRKISSNVGGEYTKLKEHLDKMSNYITSSNAPYGIHRPRNKNAFTLEKLIGPSMFDSPSFAYDNNSFFVGMSYNVINSQTTKFSLMYLLGILNSMFAKYWFLKNAKHRGVGVDVGVTKLREFPLVKNPVNQIVKDIELTVKSIIEKLHCDIENDIFEQVTRIDKLVYHLYGLTYDEVLIVDPETPITREEYERGLGDRK